MIDNEAEVHDHPSTGASWVESYPRPQLVRQRWLSLDGSWQLSRVAEAAGLHRPEAWGEAIIVPFAPEAPLSGIGDEGYHRVLWYRRQFEVPAEWSGERVILHFGAVDRHASVWVNGELVAEHEGGFTPFAADITDSLRSGSQELVVRAVDEPDDMAVPRGKQDWLPEPHGIWYPRTTGIWQSVWLEPVAGTRVERLRYTPDLGRFSITLEAEIAGPWEGAELELSLSLTGRELAVDRVKVLAGTVRREISLPDPGIGNARAEFLWSPESPNLIDVRLRLTRGDETLDEVESYTALREVAARDDRFLLNGRPYFLRLALDQGYWRDGLMTAPSATALRRDVELTKELGFNGVRKHQKIEDPRFLFWADRLGLLVWEELPSAYSFSPRALQRLAREWLEVIERDYSHPCIVAWVVFNESWGVPDLPGMAQQRDAVSSLYRLTKALDPTRPAVGNDGWEFVEGDLFTIHDYDAEPKALASRYESRTAIEAILESFRPMGRALFAEEGELGDRPVILSEFGGIRFSNEAEGWGYSEVGSSGELVERYGALVWAASGAGLAGFCYTQLTDTFQEQNGLLTMERRPKAELELLSRATRNEAAG
jgi:beta-galactosidase/beta-glucuronidase